MPILSANTEVAVMCPTEAGMAVFIVKISGIEFAAMSVNPDMPGGATLPARLLGDVVAINGVATNELRAADISGLEGLKALR